MFYNLLQFLKVSYPILIGISILLLHFVAKNISDRKPQLNIKLGFIGLKTVVSSLFLFRVVITVIALLFFMVPAIRDYSDLFPEHLKMEVYFDDDGLRRIMDSWPSNDLRSLNVAEDWEAYRVQYLSDMNDEVKERFDEFRFQFSGKPGSLHSVGWSIFPVRTRKGIWQSYQIVEAHGKLTHTYFEGTGEKRTLTSEFKLRKSPADYISLSLADIYFRFGIMLKPEFEQIVCSSTIGSPELVYVLTAATWVKIFPVPVISDTIYFRTRESDGKRVPIGYARYSY